MKAFSEKVENLIADGIEIGALPHRKHLDGHFVGFHSPPCTFLTGDAVCTCSPIIFGVNALSGHTYVLIDKRK